MKVVAVVQARAGSTRLPRKVLEPLHGEPVLVHVLTRALAARCADQVVLATTTAAADDAVAELGARTGVLIVRGSEEDVLERYVAAAEASAADVVVRLTGDCPLVDPRLIDRVVSALLAEHADYAGNVSPPTYPDGYDVEAVTSECLARLDREATRAYEREHVTARAREHPDAYRHAAVRSRRDLSNIRMTVDTAADLERLERVLGSFPAGARPGLGAILEVLAGHPELAEDRGTIRDHKYLAQRAPDHDA